ncbi:ParB N-terminal domain-containing protein [Corynebacterium sp. YIM 101645]|uniref:ParB N-terminal domain-containing protein n=1 Tax=Corynebacterium lemuris TaxID=1859292 RepID=A0ABT2FX17_9CORY|nr:ParB N-terminal domain-containing protein [Corynebacterium lemuris]MCS5479781.1 ParB N-terminal domain-containing protein [Corynebacterium lemuris]
MTTPSIVGNHPYADEFPMASEEELAELTESIGTVGLIHPIVLTPDGLVLDGRNRLEACRRAGVDPIFETREGDDDDFKEFVIGVNTTGRRESMTVQIAAASVALILGYEKRINGQWKRNSVPVNTESRTNTWKDAIRQAGTVLDALGPPHLRAVRDGETTLNAVYEEARREKERIENAERLKVEQARQEEDREQYATEYFDQHAAAAEWLSSKPDGVFETRRAAFAAYQEYNREARAAEEVRRQEEERRQQEHRDAIQRDANRLKGFLVGYGQAWGMRDHPHRGEVLDLLDPAERKRFITIEGEITWPEIKN